MDISIVLILIITAVSTSLLGVFLVLRKMSMMIDSISHTVLLGIVLAFMVVGDISSPFLIISAGLMGVVTVFLTSTLVKSKKTSEDSAVGLIFPLLFSIAVIIISKKFNGVHLDIDAVLLGKVELAPYDPLIINGFDLGPKLLYISLIVLIVNLVFVKVFFKELKIISFDSALAATLGFMPVLIHYLLMFLVSITAVTSFNAVGSVLVVALMIGPAATAGLITSDLKKVLLLSAAIGVGNSLVGYWLAYMIDSNISGVIATLTLVTFLLVALFEPKKGIVSTIVQKHYKKIEIDSIVLLFHLANHENDEKEVSINKIALELNWRKNKFNTQLKQGVKKGYIRVQDDILGLTSLGKEYVKIKESELRVK